MGKFQGQLQGQLLPGKTPDFLLVVLRVLLSSAVFVALVWFLCRHLLTAYLREHYVHPEMHMERNPLPRAHAGVCGPTDWNEALDIIVYGAPEQVIINLNSDASENFRLSFVLKLMYSAPLPWYSDKL